MSNAAQNKLGELFVDIGVGGLGKTLKGLNSVSASFLLTKNAAMQAIKPIIGMTKQTGMFGVNIDKMSTSLGVASRELQRWQYYLKLKNLDPNAILGGFESLQDAFQSFWEKATPFSNDMVFRANKLGIDLLSYTSSWEDQLRLIEDIGKAIKDLPEVEQRASLKDFHLDPHQMMYFYKKIGTTNLKAMPNEISDAQLDNLVKQSEAINKAKEDFNQSMAKIFAEHGEKITDLINKTDNLIQKIPDATNKIVKFTKDNPSTVGSAVVGNTLFGIPGALIGGVIGAAQDSLEKTETTNAYIENHQSPFAPKVKGKATGRAANMTNINTTTNNGYLGDLPSFNEYQETGAKSIIYNNNMTINQTINTNDAMQAANQSNKLIKQTQDNAFQNQVRSEL